MDEGLIMDREEKKRCIDAGYDSSGNITSQCKVYSRYIVHNASNQKCGCPDCSFATLTRLNDKPIWGG